MPQSEPNLNPHLHSQPTPFAVSSARVTAKPSKNEQVVKPHNIQDLITLFSHTFNLMYNTQLVIGNDEPLYLPASNECSYHQIIFAHGYFASALHEIAHWCIAGKKRRLQEDFGYWYEPDGRDEHQQQLFESVEVKPQAIEWAFCLAANKNFSVSVDNLNGCETNTKAFTLLVLKQVESYINNGFPKRAQQFINRLAEFYQTSAPLSLVQFKCNLLNVDYS